MLAILEAAASSHREAARIPDAAMLVTPLMGDMVGARYEQEANPSCRI
jgi:hypothetical protein